MTTTANRRTVLAILGLSTASTVAAADFAQKVAVAGRESHGHFHVGFNSEGASGALRALADQIDAGTAGVHGIEVNSKIAPEDFMTHSLIVNFSLQEKV